MKIKAKKKKKMNPYLGMRQELKSRLYWLISRGNALNRYAPYQDKDGGSSLGRQEQ